MYYGKSKETYTTTPAKNETQAQVAATGAIHQPAGRPRRAGDGAGGAALGRDRRAGAPAIAEGDQMMKRVKLGIVSYAHPHAPKYAAAIAACPWADLLGIERPQWSITDTVDKAHTEYHGEPTSARAKLAFIDIAENVRLELIEPLGEPSTWAEFLAEHGDAIHHVAFGVHDMDTVIARLDAQDIPLVQKGDYTGGRYAYVDGQAKLGAVIELLEDF